MTETRTNGMRWVFILLAGYFLLQIGVRLATSPSLDLDEAEQAFRSQWLAAGYGPQPPFYNWLQYSVFQLTGISLAALSVVKNLLLFASYLFYGLTARLILRDRALAAIATLGLLTIPQVAFEMQRDLTHTVAVFFSACLFLYGFVRSLKAPDAASYAVAGVGIGFGLLSKYNFALLPAAALLAALLDAQMRRRIFDRRILLTAAVSLVVILPHLFWLKDNLGFATARTLEKLTDSGGAGYAAQVAMGAGSFVLAILGFSAVTLVVFAIVFGKRLPAALSGTSEWTQLFERMMLFFAAGILLLVIFAGAANVKDRWLVPLLFVAPLYLCLKIEASGSDTRDALRRFLPAAVLIMIAVPAALFGTIVSARFTGHYERLNIPFARLVPQLFAEARPGAILAGDSLLAGNLRMSVPDLPIVALDYAAFRPDLPVSAEHPLLLVWRVPFKDKPTVLPEQTAAWLAANPATTGATPEISTIDVPYFHGRGEDSYRFGYAWIAPAGGK